MKKIYFSFLFIAGILQISNAQLSLTKAANEPVIGDVTNRQYYDSTIVVPKTTGAGQNWNFISLVSTTLTESSTYTTVASTPSAAYFPAATISEDQGGGNYQHYKSTLSTYEVQGLQFPSTIVNFSNTAIFSSWPINFGYNVTDPFGGSTTASTVTTNMTGTVNVNASGTGTVVMPGGLTLTNCLQVVVSVNFILSQGTYSQAGVQKEYYYYHSSNKFPVLRVRYQTSTTGTVVTKSFDARVNTAVVAGITTNQLNNEFSVFPNPARETINVALTNNSNLPVSASLTNMLGQVVITENLGNTNLIRSNVNISTLPKGLYFMNVKVGEAVTIRKIIIE
ncbi:MAG TPA: T9SS type A sorting domain-containing protein [Bacteroidia bacterium]|jgi:hypothetical protein|nr:T9SS type A sorting domain-containing protein [Bacteroidia bacterium]